MLRTLGEPVSFLGLAVGFVVSVLVLQYAQAWAARLLGDRRALRQVGPRHAFDPFGVVAAVVSVPGWGRAAEPRVHSPGRRAVALVVGPVAVAVVGVAALLGYLAVGGPRWPLTLGVGPGDVMVSRGQLGLPDEQAFLLCAGLAALGFAVLALVPLPPLTGWKLLALLSPRSPGWQKAHYWLEERNFGILALLVLLLIPLGTGGVPLLVDLIDTLVGLLTSAL